MARKAARIYVPLDSNFFDDDKVIAAGEQATYLFINMLTKAKQLDVDGVLSRAQIERLAVKGWQRRLTTLVDVGLVEETVPGAYALCSWLKWNESREQREERLKADRDRKNQKGGGGK